MNFLVDELKNLIGLGVVSVGRHSYGNARVSYFQDATKLTIGSFTSIASAHFILGGGHNTEFVSTYPFFCNPHFPSVQHPGSPDYPVSKGNIDVGNDVWIAADVTVLSGVYIADGSVVGAGSVVTKSTKPYSVNVGVPCRQVSTRFSSEIITKLCALKWWDLDDVEVSKISNLLCSRDIDTFLALIGNARKRDMLIL